MGRGVIRNEDYLEELVISYELKSRGFRPRSPNFALFLSHLQYMFSLGGSKVDGFFRFFMSRMQCEAILNHPQYCVSMSLGANCLVQYQFPS